MANPIINSLEKYTGYDYDPQKVMTPTGVMTNFLILGAIMLLPALVCWNWAAMQYFDKVYMASMVGAIGGLIVAIITAFNPKASPYLAPVYAILEGLVLGGFSAIVELQFPGVVVQAVAATIVTIFAMVALYKSKLIEVTDKFRAVLFTATLSIGCLYLISFLASWLFHNSVISNYLWSSTPLSIGLSVVFCLIAAFNLLIDFDNIERFSQLQAPKYMEWYCAFGLLVTVVWLYMELLRLLSKLNRR